MISSSLQTIYFSQLDPASNWIESKWFIAILGSLSGVIVVLLIDYFRYLSKRKKIILGLYQEIELIYSFFQQNLPIIEETLKDTQSGRRIELAYPGVNFGERYAIYLNNIIFLGLTLESKIFLYYKYQKDIDKASLLLHEKSEKYRNNDSAVSKKDMEGLMGDVCDKLKKGMALRHEIVSGIINWSRWRAPSLYFKLYLPIVKKMVESKR